MSLPEIGKLSLESHVPQQSFSRRLGTRGIFNENDDKNNVFMTSESDRQIFEHSVDHQLSVTPTKPLLYEESKNNND
jgi:hypothetical protein